MALDELVPGGVGLTLSLGATAWFGRTVFAGLAARGWPSVDGEVISAELRELADDTRSATERSAVAALTYRFTVQGVSYTGHRVDFGDFIDANRFSAEATIRRYPAGSRVAVFHDPKNPTKCALRLNIRLRAWVFFIGAAVMTLVIARALFG